MIKVRITDDHFDLVVKRLEETPVYDYSHRKQSANEVGLIGEVIVEDYLTSNNVKLVHDNFTTHDYRLVNNKTIDVKTKDRTVVPQDFYECSVPLYNHEHQRPNFYIFVSLLRDRGSVDIKRFKEAYIVGAARQKDIEEKGVEWKAGQTDPSNGTTFWTDCLNIQISDCKPFEEVVEIWSKL
jgi:hypothetical protein